MELLLDKKGNVVPKKTTEADTRKLAEFRLALICIIIGLLSSTAVALLIYLFVEESDARTIVAVVTLFLSSIGVPLFSYVLSDAINQCSAVSALQRHPDDGYQQPAFTLQ